MAVFVSSYVCPWLLHWLALLSITVCWREVHDSVDLLVKCPCEGTMPLWRCMIDGVVLVLEPAWCHNLHSCLLDVVQNMWNSLVQHLADAIPVFHVWEPSCILKVDGLSCSNIFELSRRESTRRQELACWLTAHLFTYQPSYSHPSLFEKT
jgi:hypothetical protein